MYQRRKILLALLQAFDGNTAAIDFQKYLFLLVRELGTRHYDFVPYKYGCYSFQSYYDKRILIKYGMLCDDDNRWILNKSGDYLQLISHRERDIVLSTKEKYSALSGEALLRYIYKKYPYYASNSLIAKDILTASEYEEVGKTRNNKKDHVLFTIGYEGSTIEHYINRLIKSNVKAVCDVRKHPISKKYGFSKNQLKDTLEKFTIEYHHFPELGIDTDKRKNLSCIKDYQDLFKEYKMSMMCGKSDVIKTIYNLIKEKKRIAITCFEADYNKCHRSIVAQKVSETSENCLPIINI